MARWRRDASRGGEMVARWRRGGGEIGDRTARWQAGGEVRALSAEGLPQPSYCRNANGATLSVISLMCVHVYIQRGRGERVRGVGYRGREWSVEVASVYIGDNYIIYTEETCVSQRAPVCISVRDVLSKFSVHRPSLKSCRSCCEYLIFWLHVPRSLDSVAAPRVTRLRAHDPPK